jgi:hypothetical protein
LDGNPTNGCLTPDFEEFLMKIDSSVRRTFSLLVLVSGSLLIAQVLPSPPSDSADGPDEAMMAPVTALARYMGHVDGVALPPVFAGDGLVIVENFPPYIFSGKDAAAHWDAGYRKHVESLKDLQCEFGKAHDFDRNGDRVYFVLPTTWRGVQPGSRFEEHGAWAFVLARSLGQWRIIAYGWGANDETDWQMKTP